MNKTKIGNKLELCQRKKPAFRPRSNSAGIFCSEQKRFANRCFFKYELIIKNREEVLCKPGKVSEKVDWWKRREGHMVRKLRTATIFLWSSLKFKKNFFYTVRQNNLQYIPVFRILTFVPVIISSCLRSHFIKFTEHKGFV